MKKTFTLLSTALVLSSSTLAMASAIPGTKGHVMHVAAKDGKAFAYYSDLTVSLGNNRNFGAYNDPVPYKVQQTVPGGGELFTISANNSMHFAWYTDGTVSAGSGTDLDSKRTRYSFSLAPGYTMDDVIAISSNDSMHFAWYSDGKVSAGHSDDLDAKRAPYPYQIANGYSIDDIVAITSNDDRHFVYYSDGRGSSGISNNLAKHSSGWFYQFADGYALNGIEVVSVSVDISDDNLIIDDYVSDQITVEDISNNSGFEAQQTYSFGQSVTNVSSFTLTQELGVGVEFSFTAKVPFVGEGTTTASMNYSVGSEQTTTVEKTEDFSYEKSITAPAFTCGRAVSTVSTVDNLVADMTMTFVLQGSVGERQLTTEELQNQMLDNGFSGVFLDSGSDTLVKAMVNGQYTGSFGLSSNTVIEGYDCVTGGPVEQQCEKVKPSLDGLDHGFIVR